MKENNYRQVIEHPPEAETPIYDESGALSGAGISIPELPDFIDRENLEREIF
jgi:hypothetical protein